MNLRDFARYDHFIKNLKELADFPDDGEFLVKIKNKRLPLEFRIRAPSKQVLQHAIWRFSEGKIDDEIEIKSLA